MGHQPVERSETFSDHWFRIRVGDAESTGSCIYLGLAEGPRECGRRKGVVEHRQGKTIYMPWPEKTEVVEDNSEEEKLLVCRQKPCGFDTFNPDEMLAHKDAHAIFVREPEPSPFRPKPFESEGAAAVIAHSEAVLALVREKDKAYQGAWKEQGYMGNLARIQSKAARLKNMLWMDYSPENENQVEPDGESVMDTLHDLMALCAFALTNIEEGNRWGR